MSRISSLLMFILAVLLIVIAILSASPPAIKLGEVPDTCFSVKRAYSHLLKISRLPHSTGTVENARVREYIAATCRQMGFTVEIQNTTSINNGWNFIQAANVYNVIALKKGQHNSKSVVLMAHYDSQVNTQGAGDDGAGVASMLETARALQKVNLQNDLILLFTDGEEIGLMGANAFVKESPLVKGIGLVINFEGRGNAGPSTMFEVNAGNGWAINEYAKSVAHPFANSLGYELYKKLPNNTDYTPFKNAGITGLNNAYIDGFVNYHSPNDKPENMDLRSLQHHGDNMLSLVKHFGNLTITGTKTPDASYFNVIGNWFIHYPASWNLAFVLLTDLLFIFFLLAGIKNKSIKIGGFIISTLLFPAFSAITYFSAKYLLKVIISLYPLYSHFDENNSYNSPWYFLAMSALAVTLFSFIYLLVAKKINSNTLLAGILFIVVILMNGMQYAVPSGSYLLFIPLFFILISQLFLSGKNWGNEKQSNQWNFLNLLSVVPAICFIAPAVYFTFLAFGLGSNMPFVVVGAGMFTALLLPVLYPCFKNQKLFIPATALLCFFLALVKGQLTSGYSEKYPLPSNLHYTMDADSSRAKWLSDFSAPDKWSVGFFKKTAMNKKGIRHNGRLINDAPVLPLLPPTAVITKDTLHNGKRTFVIHFNPSREKVNFINIAIADSCKVNSVFIDGKQTKVVMDGYPTHYRNISYTGVTSKGFDVIFEMECNKKLDIILSDRSIGLPIIAGINTSYPKDIVADQRGNSNTIQVRKRFIF
ncbi:MAG: M20/M25/M40 family metallo-hydrolase [Ferruginibacter sp.]|nr:M20/M25/M40 family metallo-hydrolase [Ferruginibacter sp.]